MKVLSIGNSFSEDSQRYLHRIAKANGKDLKTVNLMIGGCSLQTHFINIQDNARAYNFHINGEITNIPVTVCDALKSDNWDVITLQQASHFSFKIDTYKPYIEKIAEWIHLRTDAKIYLHQTWAYPEHKERLSEMGFKTTEEMFNEVRASYKAAADLIRPDAVIKSGEAMLSAYREMPGSVYRDPIHASLGFGRYLLGNVWYKTLFGETPVNDISEFDEPISTEELNLIKKITDKI